MGDSRPVLSERRPVMAAHRWPTNAHLIEDVARLYLYGTDRILDPTYGRGIWWQRWSPAALRVPPEGTDFRALPYADGEFDVVAFDPPYVSTGGRTTSTIGDFNDRFGLVEAPRTPALLQQMILDGLAECIRVVRPRWRQGADRGLLLVKCADYISSGRLHPGTHLTLTAALKAGCSLVDRFEHIGNPRPQPLNRTRADGQPVRQVHARRNLSTLFVLAAPVRRPT